jgi:hypothetical protein
MQVVVVVFVVVSTQDLDKGRNAGLCAGRRKKRLADRSGNCFLAADATSDATSVRHLDLASTPRILLGAASSRLPAFK